MMTTPKDILLLKNEAGDYYVLPLELLERGRVPAEQIAEAEYVFAAATDDDVTGHLSLSFTKIGYQYRLAGTLFGGSPAIGALFSDVANSAVIGGMTQEVAAQSERQPK